MQRDEDYKRMVEKSEELQEFSIKMLNLIIFQTVEFGSLKSPDIQAGCWNVYAWYSIIIRFLFYFDAFALPSFMLLRKSIVIDRVQNSSVNRKRELLKTLTSSSGSARKVKLGSCSPLNYQG